jgi:hypothetical protein
MKSLLKGVSSVSSQTFLLMSMVALSSCISNIPVSDYAMARTAWESAKESGAARLAPSVWYRADQAYKKGQKLFTERDYSGARDSFEEARFYSEKAENTARLTSPEGGAMP